MLQFNALRPDTLDVLKLTMNEPLLNDFTLVGGTALALHFGHRISEDIDLFSWERFNVDVLLNELESKIKFSIKIKTPIGAHLFIETVKTDIVYFPIKPMREPILQDGVRLLQLDDLAAMKLNAIANRGAKKDFYDLFFLLEAYSIEKLIELFVEKFKQQDVFGLSKSIGYFKDADEEDTQIIVLKDKALTWQKVKEKILKETHKIL